MKGKITSTVVVVLMLASIFTVFAAPISASGMKPTKEGLYFVWSKGAIGEVLRDYGNMKIVRANPYDLKARGCIYFPADYIKYIGLNNLKFDPLTNMPKIPKVFKSDSTELYIVQFFGPPSKNDISELQKLGEVIWYIPQNAYLVKIKNPNSLKNLENLRWFGAYHPYYKISQKIYDEYLKSVAIHNHGFSKILSGQGEYIPVTITAYSDNIPIFKSIQPFYISKVGKFVYIHGLLNIKDLPKIASEDSILYVQKYVEPRLFDELSTEIVGGSYGGFGAEVHKHGLRGDGIIVAIADTGIDTGSGGITHPDLADRVIAIWDASGGDGHDGYGHGTHCAGIIAGTAAVRFSFPQESMDENGYYYGLGVAPHAKLVAEKIFSDSGSWLGADPVDMAVFAQSNGAIISSNSWGAAVNGEYDDFSQIYDILTRDANPYVNGTQQILFVFAAGNEGPNPQTVGSPGSAKNVLTVGATGNDRFGDNHEMIADFSSRGPTADGRIKPDVVAPGTWIASALSQAATPGWAWGNINKWYEWCGGTSQATPHGAGSAAIFAQYYKGIYGKTPSPAMIKAALIVSAVDINGSGAEEPIPNYNEGWGMIYLPNIIDPPYGEEFIDSPANLQTGEEYTFSINVVDSSIPLKITMAYTDKEGAVNANPALVNDLNLVVIDPNGNTYVGNNFQNGWTVPGNATSDNLNNVECVYIKNPVVGRYTVKVMAQNVPEDSVPSTPEIDQDFSVAIIGGIDVYQHYSAVRFEKDYYKPGDNVKVIVVDSYANTDPYVKDSVKVDIETASGDKEKITLIETSTDSGVFTSLIPTSLASPTPNDGILQVSTTDVINASYLDYLGSWRHASTTVDGIPPTVTNVSLVEVKSDKATIIVETSESTSLQIHYGTYGNLGNVSYDSYNTIHTVTITNLIPWTDYYFYIYVEDIAGNGVVDDNNSNYYHFKTKYPADILVVADDGGNYQYSTALLTYQLDKLGVNYDLWDTSVSGSPSYPMLASHLIVFWNCGPAWSDTLSDEDQQNLAKFMDNGGRLVLMGQDILWDIGVTPLFSNYLHISDVYQDMIYGYQTTVYGISGNPITGNYTSGLSLNSTYYLYMDELVTDGSSEVSPLFNDEYSYPAAVMVDNSTYRAIFMAFPYECLVIDEENASIDITQKILKWLLPQTAKDIYAVYDYSEEYTILGNDHKVKVLVVNKDNVSHTVNVTLNIDLYDAPPIVGIISPHSGDTLTGMANISVYASDDYGINRVEIYLDNNLLNTLYAQPYSTTINTENYSNGPHTIKAVAYDTKNQSSQAEISVNFFNINQTGPYGYKSRLYAYNWINVRGNPSAWYVGGGDDSAYNITLPFNFRFYDKTQNYIYVCTNGFLSLDYYTSFSNQELPTTSVPYLIAPFWDDLKNYTTEQGIYAMNITYSGRNATVIEWYIPHLGGDTYGIFDFEAILLDNGTIIFQYNNTYVGYTSWDNGSSATVGIQGDSGNLGYILISYNNGVIKNGMAIRFTPPWALKFQENFNIRKEHKLPHISSVYTNNASVTIPPKSAVWVTMNWTPSSEGIYVVNVSVNPEPTETIISNNKVSHLLYVRELKGTIKVAVVDSWASDYFQYASLEKIENKWYKYGDYKIIFDITSLNKDDITLNDIIDVNPSLLLISNAWSSSNGWEFSDSEVSALKIAVSMGYGVIGTSGTFDSSNAPNNMKLAPIFGLDENAGGYWADSVTTINALNTSHPIFKGLPPSFSIGYGYACVGLVNKSAKVIGETDAGSSTGKKGILTDYSYGGGRAVYMPYMAEVMYANDYDITLLYNTIIYVYNTSYRPNYEVAAVNISADKEWMRPGESVNITVTAFNGGTSATSATLTLYAIYENLTQVVVGSSTIFIPSGGFGTKTFSFTPTAEGKITLKFEVSAMNDLNSDNNVVYSNFYCRVPHGPILVAGVDSLGAKFPDIMVWDEISKYWYRYGNYTIMYDMHSLVDKNITYDGINSTHADVLIISDAWNNYPDSGIWWEFSDSEINAIKQYISEGHGLIMTAGTLSVDNVPNNMKLADMAGLDPNAQQHWADTFSGVFVINNSYSESSYLFKYVDSPYTAGYLYTAYGWALNSSDPADMVALSTDSKAGIFFHKYGLGSVIYFSHIPEYSASANQNDKQLVYNSIVFTYTNSTQPVIDNTPPTVNITSIANGDVICGVVGIEVEAHDDISFVTLVEISISNGTTTITIPAKYDYLTGRFKASYDTTLLSDGAYTITATAYDKYGNFNSTSVNVEVDNTAPDLEIISPPPWAVIIGKNVTISWRSWDPHLDHNEIEMDGGRWINVGLSTHYTFTNVSYGTHVIVVRSIDTLGHYSLSRIMVVSQPMYASLYPTGIINNREPQISVKLNNTNVTDASFSIDGIEIPFELISINGQYTNASVPFLLSDGKHKVTSNITISNGSHIFIIWYFYVDAIPPNLTITSPPNGNLPLTYNNTMWINGTTDPGCSVYINGTPINVSSNGSFSTIVKLVPGFNVFIVTAVDQANNSVSVRVTALYLPQIPQLMENITSLWENISALWSTVNWLNNTLSDVEQNVSYIWENITNIYQEISELRNALQENVSKLKNAILENRTDILNRLQQNVTKLEGEIQNVSNDLSTQIDNLRNELYGEVNRLDARIDELKGNVTQLHAELNSLWNALDENITMLKESLGENYTALLNAMNNITQLMNQLNSLSEYVDSQLSSLENKNKEQDSGITMDMIIAVIALIVAIVALIIGMRKGPKIPENIVNESGSKEITPQKKNKSGGLETDILEEDNEKEEENIVDLDL